MFLSRNRNFAIINRNWSLLKRVNRKNLTYNLVQGLILELVWIEFNFAPPSKFYIIKSMLNFFHFFVTESRNDNLWRKIMIHVKMYLFCKVGTRYDRNYNLGLTVNHLNEVGNSSWKSRKIEAAEFQVFSQKSRISEIKILKFSICRITLYEF